MYSLQSSEQRIPDHFFAQLTAYTRQVAIIQTKQIRIMVSYNLFIILSLYIFLMNHSYISSF